jgi:cardiolipin synthase
LSKKRGGQGWQDMVIKLCNANVKDLSFAYAIAWDGFPMNLKIKKRLQKINLEPVFRLNYSRHLRRSLYKSLLSKIAKAKHHIWVTSAYFNPDYFILKKLKLAAKKGIDVRLVLPDESDVPLMKMVTATFYGQLIKAGVSIYEYLPGILHAKAINIDDWYSIGSSNLNHRSLRHDLEVDVDVQTQAAKQAAYDWLNAMTRDSRKLALSDLKKQPFYKRFLVYFLLLGKYFY